MKIIVFGGTGLLGNELLRLNPEIICHGSKMDIRNYHYIRAYLHDEKPDIVINAAAITDNRKIEIDSTDAIKTNIIGSSNVALVCNELNTRLVYISTDYVYKGVGLGNHKEADPILPHNLYAWTKLGGECSTKCVENHLIIRTSFGADKFAYQNAYTNQQTSKDYVDVIAPMILKAALSKETGVINIGTEQKTMYEYASRRSTVIGMPNEIPLNHSLNLNKYNSNFNPEFNETK